MKIIILGAGQTGTALAEYLVTNSENDITVIDHNQHMLQSLQERFDLQVIHGQPSHPDILKNAGANDADMLVAVTSSDETNMVACQIGCSLFSIPNKVARIRSPEYTDDNLSLFNPSSIPIDHIIAPEKLITDNIYNLVQYPGAMQVAMFNNHQVAIVAVTAYYGGALVGDEISALKKHSSHIETRIVAIYRQGKFIKPLGSTIIEAGDEIYFTSKANNVKTIISEFQRLEKPYKRIIIGGGGSIAVALAKLLENHAEVKLIESSMPKSELVAEQLANTIVLNGEPSDQELLSQEQINSTDLFIAVTNDDESNIMSAMLAKKMGAKKVIVLIQKQAYLELITDSVIDIALSPQHASISALLSHIRQSDVIRVATLRLGTAEAIEIVAHGDDKTSKVVGRSISEIRLAGGASIGAVIREDAIFIGNDDIKIEDNDHLLIFLPDRKYINDIERLFKTR